MNGKKIYIAGKITGYDGYKERFAAAEKELKSKGALPMNPALLPPGYDQGQYLHICFSMIDVCEAVYFINNWKDSPGALKEFDYATCKKKEILYEEDLP